MAGKLNQRNKDKGHLFWQLKDNLYQKNLNVYWELHDIKEWLILLGVIGRLYMFLMCFSVFSVQFHFRSHLTLHTWPTMGMRCWGWGTAITTQESVTRRNCQEFNNNLIATFVYLTFSIIKFLIKKVTSDLKEAASDKCWGEKRDCIRSKHVWVMKYEVKEHSFTQEFCSVEDQVEKMEIS